LTELFKRLRIPDIFDIFHLKQRGVDPLEKMVFLKITLVGPWDAGTTKYTCLVG
jgi:hypothetical protein